MADEDSTRSTSTVRRPLRILFVEDNPRDVKLTTLMLERTGYDITYDAVDLPELFQAKLQLSDYDVIVSDFNLGSWTAMEALEIVRNSGKEIPFLVVSGSVGDETAAECIKMGATDYILKDRMARMPNAIERALHARQARDEQKRAEEVRLNLELQLRQSQKMEAVGQLAGGVAHDFNNLLTVINGYSELMMAEAGEDHPFHQSLSEIKRSGERAAALTRQLLAFSRRQVLLAEVVDLNDVITGMHKMLSRLLPANIDLISVPAKELRTVKADPGQIEQIIANLVVNARDAMPDGGTLTIETANVDLDENYARQHLKVKPGPHIMLAVSDTGAGMDAETQKHLFEPFFTTKEKSKGTGLGLSTVYGIVEQSGGSIWFYSEVGQGSTFKIYLPAAGDRTEIVKPNKDSKRPNVGTETVLLVEDEDSVRALVHATLVSKGYNVFQARNGGEALTISDAHQGQIHLLITDLVMPDMSGRELADRLAPKSNGMRVLFMSGYTDEDVVRRGALAAGVAFLQKPFSPDTIAFKVREVLDA